MSLSTWRRGTVVCAPENVLSGSRLSTWLSISRLTCGEVTLHATCMTPSALRFVYVFCIGQGMMLPFRYTAHRLRDHTPEACAGAAAHLHLRTHRVTMPQRRPAFDPDARAKPTPCPLACCFSDVRANCSKPSEPHLDAPICCCRGVRPLTNVARDRRALFYVLRRGELVRNRCRVRCHRSLKSSRCMHRS